MERTITACMLTVALAGCAHSHRLTRHRDARFERCYAADFDPNVQSNARHQCWATWLRNDTKGQPTHKIQYAVARKQSLERGDSPSALGATVYATSGGTYAPEPVLTRVSLDSEVKAATGQNPLHLSPPSTGDATCASACDPHWNVCTEACTERQDACIHACEAEYRTCMHACF